MSAHPQIEAYALWLKDRGLKYPVMHGTPLMHVVAEGPNIRARVLVIGDAFNANERALLDKMIAAMKLSPGDVHIAAGAADFAALLKEVEPELVVSMQPYAAAIRGRFCVRAEFGNTPVMPTLHPRVLLKEPASKRLAWADLQLVMERLK